MLFNDKTSVIISIIGIVCFIILCALDVTGIFSSMDNLAIRIIIIGIYGLLLFNVVTANYYTNDSQKNLPESEEGPTDYRQM